MGIQFTGIEYLKLPKTLKELSTKDLSYAVNLSMLDLSDTQIEEFSFDCIEGNNLKELKLPKCLKKIRRLDNPFYFKGVHLKTLDLRDTQIESMEEGSYIGLEIDELILPSSINNSSQLEPIHNAKIKSLDLSETEIKGLYGSYDVDVGWIPLVDTSVLEKIKFPKCLKEIGSSILRETENLRELDLSETQLETLGGSCLKGSGIEKIKLPKCLKRIAWNALAHTSNLKKLDLSETNVEELSSYCLDSSGIEELKLPKCLKRIEENALEGTVKLKSIDLRETQIEEIPQELIENKDVKLPKREENSVKITVEEALKIESAGNDDLDEI